MPSTITVMNLNDSGAGSLRAAIARADMDMAQDTIDFAPSVVGTIALSSALPDLSTDVILSGPSAASLTVARSAPPETPFRIFNVTAGAEVRISGLTITGGQTGEGGGIVNSGTLILSQCTLSGNSASGGQGTFSGGGIANWGTLTVTDCTLSDNIARGLHLGVGEGGGIANRGTLTVINSTFSGNIASGEYATGGAIASWGRLAVTNSTLADNLALSVFTGGLDGGGIAGGGTVTVTTSVFDNPVGGNLAFTGPPFLSGGHNLFSDTPAISLAPTDLTSTDPLLAPLGDYGGPTPTTALLPGSPAIDAGVAVAGVAADQRGVPRPRGTAPDIGAFESRGFGLSIVSGNGQETPPGFALPGPLVVRVASPFGEPVVGGRVGFSSPTTGASAVLSGGLATIGADGQAAVTASANVIAGSYTVDVRASGASGRVAFVLSNTANPPPAVASVLRLGVRRQPTRLLLFFNGPLDPARAEDTSHYTLTTVSRRPRTIAIDRASYDPATRSITLSPLGRLRLTRPYRLTVRGGGPHGTDFTTEVFGGGFPSWIGAVGPGLSNSPLGNDGPTASAVDALFARSGRIH